MTARIETRRAHTGRTYSMLKETRRPGGGRKKGPAKARIEVKEAAERRESQSK